MLFIYTEGAYYTNPWLSELVPLTNQLIENKARIMLIFCDFCFIIKGDKLEFRFVSKFDYYLFIQ